MKRLLSSTDWRNAELLSKFFHINPFSPERVKWEREVLGPACKDEGTILWARPGEGRPQLLGNVPALCERAEARVSEMRRLIEGGRTATSAELLVYEGLALCVLYGRHMESLEGLVKKSLHRSGWDGRASFWPDFQADFQHFLHLPGHELPSRYDPRVIFASLFQKERAFTHTYSRIIGAAKPVADLRAAIWQSIFTHDIRRYIRSLHRTMADVPTLIVGPSGSGKELVARAIGKSCFIRFDPGTERFAVGKAEMYYPVNLSAPAPTLVESELFGHVQGAFSAAYEDRKGWLEQCEEYSAVFLDEIGELDAAIQAKLLRVLESRRFQKVGDTETCIFKGKIIAATNRDLAAEMHAGRFHEDLYYRLCADKLFTPSLAEQLAALPEDLPELVRFIAQKVLTPLTYDPDELAFEPTPDDDLTKEVERLTAEVVTWIDRELGRNYAWPGNLRELGQCVRNVMIRGSYYPAKIPLGPVEELLRQVRGVEVTADELLGRYYALAYHRSHENYMAAARPLGVDWRVVKGRLDQTFLERLRHSGAVEGR
jgi:DNA-binding NtrC family response regulator